jgi:predicted MPP superfamily phosphohydrolase
VTPSPFVDLFVQCTGAAWLVLVVTAFIFRSKSYAFARGILVGIHSLVAVALFPLTGPAWPLFVYLHGCVFVQSLMLVRPRMRPLAYRALVSLPDAFFQAGTILAFPWAIAIAAGATHPPGWWVSYVFAAIGMAQCFMSDDRHIDLVVADGESVDGVRRHPHGDTRDPRPLRIVQITDPHLGAFMSVDRLRRISQRAVELNPDLVLLTGDFLTMESQTDPDVLFKSFEPLKQLPGRVFACLGNHDLEAPHTVRAALARAGATLLIDDARVVSTDAGPVQVVGADFKWRGRREHLQKLSSDHPRDGDALRILMLHDPAAFKHVPAGEADLVLSGHTLGGQLGLVSLGLNGTMISLFSSSPDHGFWARGTDRLYVHKGTGHYGFPVRIGVPAEQSMLLIHRAR